MGSRHVGFRVGWTSESLLWSCAIVLWFAAGMPVAGTAQDDEGPVIRDSSVGYIDSAIPGTTVRFRYDAAYANRQPSRAEFFWPRSGPAGPGPALPETGVDYQDFLFYGEAAICPCGSLFLEAPIRLVNPEVNSNAEGVGDVNVGLKHIVHASPDWITTAQLRVYTPTGDGSEGLGTRHVSLEPALLAFAPLSERLRFEGELRYWIPLGGTEFAGDVLRYGAGLQLVPSVDSMWQVTPVVEFVGWTVLDGLASAAVGPGQFVVTPADGTTIVNFKAGLRTQVGSNSDLYVGWGHPLTGANWYENTVRVELRWYY